MELLQGFLDLLAETLQTVSLASRAAGWGSLPPLAAAAGIFILRTIDQALSVNRTLAVFNGRRKLAWILGFTQSLFFVTAVSGVLAALNNPLNLISYAGGYAMGAFIGISLEGQRPAGHSILRIISPTRGAQIVDRMRAAGHGVTEFPGTGKDGTVSVILCAVPRRKISGSVEAISQVDPAAFVTVEHIRPLSGGWQM